MAKVIYQYSLAHGGVVGQVLNLPFRARPIFACMQNGTPTIWVETETDTVITNPRRFSVYPTGQRIPDTAKYVATIRDDPYIWHVYEEHQ